MTANGRMFVPLSDSERASATEAGRSDADKCQLAIPVPDNVPEPNWSKLRPIGVDGDPTNVWTYHTANGSRAFLVARWDKPDGGKEIRPVTWTGLWWECRAMLKPQPPYKLPELLSQAEKPVLIVEGEKCADAAATVFPDHVTTTWAGGSSAWDKTDWSPLAGHKVLLVADADEPGRRAMTAIAGQLAELDCTVRVTLPSDAEGIDGRTGRDIADVLAEFGADTARDWVESPARDWSPENGTDNTAKDWKDALVERSATDKGAPFEPDMIRKIANLKRNQPAGWERLLSHLKEKNQRSGR